MVEYEIVRPILRGIRHFAECEFDYEIEVICGGRRWDVVIKDTQTIMTTLCTEHIKKLKRDFDSEDFRDYWWDNEENANAGIDVLDKESFRRMIENVNELLPP